MNLKKKSVRGTNLVLTLELVTFLDSQNVCANPSVEIAQNRCYVCELFKVVDV